MKNLAVTGPLLALLAACVSTPDVEGVIQGTSRASESAAGQRPLELEVRPYTRDELRSLADERRAAMNARCRELLPAALADDATYEDLMLASRALIFNADLRIQSNVALRFDPTDLPKPLTLINAEDGVGSEIKADVRSLAQESRELADRARDLRPSDPAAELFSTLGIGLCLWSMGPMQAIANGATSTLPKRIKAIAKAHPDFEGASPLRLKGRFQSRAPWPYKDKQGAVAALSRAVSVAPIPLNLLFLGDAQWIAEENEAAIESWKLGVKARADAETEFASPFLREICRLRVESARKND